MMSELSISTRQSFILKRPREKSISNTGSRIGSSSISRLPSSNVTLMRGLYLSSRSSFDSSYWATASRSVLPSEALRVLPTDADRSLKAILAIIAVVLSAGAMVRLISALSSVPDMVSMSALSFSARRSMMMFILSVSSSRPATDAFRSRLSNDALIVVESITDTARSAAFRTISAVWRSLSTAILLGYVISAESWSDTALSESFSIASRFLSESCALASSTTGPFSPTAPLTLRSSPSIP